ncbi:MAG TPA: SDR family NAD(P)-dependent oxidoreductase, partial [Acidimicrobiales bacterium]
MSENDDRPVAIISGGARGIGAATAIHLARAGWRVGTIDLLGADDGGLAARLGYDLSRLPAPELADCPELADPDTARGAAVDVRDGPGLDAAVAGLVAHFGRLDAAVAAAGVIAGGPTGWETDDQLWADMIDVNLTGVWRLARATVPHLLARPEPRTGRFVAVASTAATEGLPRLAAYTAAKAGVVGLVRAMAAELAPHGVTVNAVCPGSTRTAMLDASCGVYGL